MNFFKMTMLFIFLLLSPLSVIAETTPSCIITFNKADNTLSVNLVQAQLSDIAGKLSKEAGIKVFLDKSVTRAVTSEFQNEPLELGIKRLLGPDINSAFIFVKEEKSGKVNFRLDTVKIVNKGNMLSAEFNVFDSTGTESKTPVAEKPDNAYHQIPKTPGAINREIMMSRKNIDMLHMKDKTEKDYIKRKILELKMKLSQNPSPEERESLVKKLGQAEQELGRITALNNRIITDEEQNIRELLEEQRKTENRTKFMQRQMESEKQRKNK